MQIGMIGLGRMGANIARRLMRHGHDVVAYDKTPKAAAELACDGVNRLISAMRHGFGGHVEPKGKT